MPERREHWRRLLQAWFCEQATMVDPPRIVDGRDLLQSLGIVPGPIVGRLLEEAREAQVAGQVVTKEQAIAWARRSLYGTAQEGDGA